MDRRNFLKSCVFAAGALSINHRLLAQLAPQLGQPRLKIGILSDVHIRFADKTDALESAFRYFCDNGADGVMIARKTISMILFPSAENIAR